MLTYQYACDRRCHQPLQVATGCFSGDSPSPAQPYLSPHSTTPQIRLSRSDGKAPIQIWPHTHAAVVHAHLNPQLNQSHNKSAVVSAARTPPFLLVASRLNVCAVKLAKRSNAGAGSATSCRDLHSLSGQVTCLCVCLFRACLVREFF